MNKIKSITKLNTAYHPALGWMYIIELESGKRFTAYDDEFYPRFDDYESDKIQSYVGQEWVEYED